MVRPNVFPGYDVVHSQVARPRVRRASRAVASLNPVQGLRVRPVRWQLSNVRTRRYVRSVRRAVRQKAKFVAKPYLDKLRGLLVYDNPDPPAVAHP